MAISRWDFENWYVTTLTQDQTLTPWVDGTLFLAVNPTKIADGKKFFVVFNVEVVLDRFVLPVYMDWWLVKYHWYDVKNLTTVHKYDTVALNDVAEIFKLLFSFSDDFWYVEELWWLDVNVFWWNVVIGNDLVVIPDTPLTLTDNSINYIVIDYVTETITAITTLSWTVYLLNTITTVWWAITTNVSNRWFNVQDYFDPAFFDTNVYRERQVRTQHSITYDGNGIKLVWDQTSPWLNKVYATDPTTGTKWRYPNVGSTGPMWPQWPQGIPGWVNDKAVLTTGTALNYLYARTWYVAYADRDIFVFQPHVTNTLNPTLNVEWLWARAIVDKDNVWLIANSLDVDTAYFVMYNASLNKFVVIGSTGVWGWTNVIWISAPQNHTIWTVATFTHNLGVTQADIESGRYEIKFTYKVLSTPAVWVDSWGNDVLSGVPKVVTHERNAADPITDYVIHHQADSLKVLSSTRWDNIKNLRCIIIDNGMAYSGGNPWTTINNVNFLVVDWSGNAITDAVLTFNWVTNPVWNYVFTSLLGDFSYSCSKLWYTPAAWTLLVDWDVTQVIVLTPTWAPLHTITFDINDGVSSITDAYIDFDGIVYPVGYYDFVVPDATYNYTVYRLGYTPVSGSVTMAWSDMIESVVLTATWPLFAIDFTVQDSLLNPIVDASIEFDGILYPVGYYNFTAPAWTFTYTVHRFGYDDYTDTITIVWAMSITVTLISNATLYTVDFDVEDTLGAPIVWANVWINGLMFPVGQYSIQLPAGTYTYIVSKSGYYPAGSFIVVVGDMTENVVLTPTGAPSTHSATFNLSTPLWAVASDYVIKVGASYYLLNQNIITGLSDWVYAYQITDAAHLNVYWFGNITIAGANIIENVILTQDARIDSPTPLPINPWDNVTMIAHGTAFVLSYLRSPWWQITSAKIDNPLVTTLYTCRITFIGWFRLTASFLVTVT